MLIPIRLSLLALLLSGSIFSCSKKEDEQVTPTQTIVGRWDALSLHLVIFNAAGDTVYQEKNSPSNAHLVFAADKTYSSYSNDIESWHGTYTWQDDFLTTVNSVQGSQSFSISALTTTSLVLFSDRRIGKEGGITITRYSRH